MFLTENDYIMAGKDALGILSGCDSGKREEAEKSAMDDITGFLYGRYDTEKIFAATGDARCRTIVKCACDIVLYDLASGLPARMGHDIRKERYDNAIKRLREIQDGKFVLDAPAYTGGKGDEGLNAGAGTSSPIGWGSGKSNTYTW